jgi:hypothetical protein
VLCLPKKSLGAGTQLTTEEGRSEGTAAATVFLMDLITLYKFASLVLEILVKRSSFFSGPLLGF